MNEEFERFLAFQGKATTAAKMLGVSRQRIHQIVQGAPVGHILAKKIVDQYPAIDLYKLLYE